MKNYLNNDFNTDDYNFVSIIDEIPLWSAPFGLDLLDSLKLRPDIVALDIGCGLGFPMIELAMRLGSTGKVYGIDPWERAIERVNLKLKLLKIENAVVVKGVAEKMPFKDEYFNLIVSNNGLNNVEDLKVSLSECKRVSKSGTQLVMTFNLENTMLEFYNAFEETMKENNLLDEITAMKAHIRAKRKTLDEVKSLLEDSGFRIGGVLRKSFKMDFLDGSTMLNHYMIKQWFLPGWKNVVKEHDQKRIFEQLEKKINIQSIEKGWFTLTIPYIVMDCTKQ